MILMVKDGEKRYIPDVAVGAYRSLGWKGDGEPDPVAFEEVVAEPAAVPAGEDDVDVEKHVCAHCGKEFGSKAALTKHMKKEHTEE
nr:MAG TPA: hypothetical protein [Caudoviricetes sp.]